AFRDDEWKSGRDPFIKRLIQCGAFFCEHTGSHLNARVGQQVNPGAAVSWIRIGRSNYYRFNSGPNDLIRARARSAFRRAGLERDIKRTVFWNLSANTVQAFDFSVGFAGLAMVPARDDSVVSNQKRPDHRVRARLPESFARFAQRGPHQSFVIVHPVSGNIGGVRSRANDFDRVEDRHLPAKATGKTPRPLCFLLFCLANLPRQTYL